MAKLHVKADEKSNGEAEGVEVLAQDVTLVQEVILVEDTILATISPEGTVLAEADSLQGRMVIAGDGQVLGQFNGDIECGGDLVIGRVAEVTATIRGMNITIAGTVRGNIIAQGRLKIASSGRLEGDARVGSLVVTEGGVHHGIIRVHPEGVPDEPEAEEQPLAQAQPAVPQTPVDRVRKFWGEFF
jgi:cytoskeletal protein CcmA (bactofilin family)